MARPEQDYVDICDYSEELFSQVTVLKRRLQTCQILLSQARDVFTCPFARELQDEEYVRRSSLVRVINEELRLWTKGEDITSHVEEL